MKLSGQVSHERLARICFTDLWQHQGLGTLLLDHLKHIARAEKLDRLTAVLLADNLAMQQLCRRRGFAIMPGANASECRAEMQL